MPVEKYLANRTNFGSIKTWKGGTADETPFSPGL